jgi:hypothetical protein
MALIEIFGSIFLIKLTQAFKLIFTKLTFPVLPDFPDYRFKIWVFSSAFTQPMNPNEGSVVTYPVVTEYDDNGSGSNGKNCLHL